MAQCVLGPSAVSHDPTKTAPSDWRDRFEALVRERTRAPFEWGKHDCCLFAADAVLAATGIDPALDMRGTYSDAQGGMEALQRIGGFEAAGARAGVECHPQCVQVGDVGLVNDGHRDLLAVCAGEVWLAPSETGLGALPLSAARKAWRVTCQQS